MRLGGLSSYYCEVNSYDDLLTALDFAKTNKIPYKVIGEGSNIIWKDEGYKGLLIKNSMKGIEIIEENDLNIIYKIASGEMLDEFVGLVCERGISGVECLSLIPGTIGATPVQNVGAYGQEIADTLVSVTALDSLINEVVEIMNKDCRFGYRSSIFKTTDKDRYLILAITLKLNKKHLTPPFYQSLESYLKTNHITSHDPLTIRNAVIDIRSSKLPDWHKIANSGSFFANPVISKTKYESLKATFPDMPGWECDGMKKIPAAWLIEHAGFKDFHEEKTGIGTWKSQALVLVNEKAKNTESLLIVKQRIVDAVKNKYDITLEQEPELLP